jgi:hypothetical protein
MRLYGLKFIALPDTVYACYPQHDPPEPGAANINMDRVTVAHWVGIAVNLY